MFCRTTENLKMANNQSFFLKIFPRNDIVKKITQEFSAKYVIYTALGLFIILFWICAIYCLHRKSQKFSLNVNKE